jgi:hypothetical protein
LLRLDANPESASPVRDLDVRRLSGAQEVQVEARRLMEQAVRSLG